MTDRDQLARIEALLHQGRTVYQPLYNYPHAVSIPGLRPCIDRCRAVEQALEPDLGSNLAARRLWDCGCSLGYNTLYFAERGMRCLGTDRDPRNIAICREIAPFTPGDVRFEVASLGPQEGRGLDAGAHDVAFFFSMLHHVIEAEGLEAVQAIMQAVTARIPLIFVELAQKREVPPPGYTWDRTLPDRDLAIFDRCGTLDISLVGHFPTHVGPVDRPLYRVARC